MPIVAALPAIAGVVGAGTSIASAFSGGEEEGKTITAEPLITDYQKNAGEQLTKWLQKYLDQYAPGEAYTGKLSASMTPQESSGLSLLDQFMSGANIGDLYKAGKSQISDTLSGKYADPNTSPFIKAMQTISEQDLNDALVASRRGTGARGKFFSTAALGEEKDLTNRNLNNLNSIIGSFIQNERQNMLSAVPVASAMDQYENYTAPLAKIQASQTYGSLSRTLEQADLERQYNDYLRKRTEMAQPVSVAQGLYSSNAPYGIKSWEMPATEKSSTLDSIASVLGGLNFNALSGSGSIWSRLSGLFGGN